MSPKRLELIFELFVFGFLLGIVEDAIVIYTITDDTLSLRDIGIIALVALPFAVFGEAVIDRVDFAAFFRRLQKKKKKKKREKE